MKFRSIYVVALAQIACASAVPTPVATVHLTHAAPQAYENEQGTAEPSGYLIEATLWASHTDSTGATTPGRSEPRRVRAVYEASPGSYGESRPEYRVTMRAFQLSRWTYPAVGNPEYYWRRALDNRWIAVGDPFVIQLANDDRWCLVETRRCTSEGGRDLFAEALASTIEAFMVRAPALPAASKAAPQRLDLPRAWSVRGVGLNKELLATPVAAGDASRFAVKLESERPPNRPKPPPGTFGANLQHPSLSLNATFTLNSGGALVEVQTEHEYTLEGTTRSHVYHWRRLRHRSPTPDALEDYELPPAPEGLGKPGASAQPACSCPQKDIKCAMTCASGQRPPASQPPLPPHLDLPDPGEPPRLYFPSAEEANERSLSSPLYVLPRL